ncbi:MAG TPA: polymorphic toxin type 15 domain-containing protein [Gaiellaceae bacterium]|nr:polymorphic toxin type 15 domain-containing protein [Gaiellaceae bacterium]
MPAPAGRSPSSGGAPLPKPVSSAISTSLGVDVSPVRVHTDANAAAGNQAFSSRAFAYGSDVFLGRGERPTDLPLMAHEVTHVVQQQGAPAVQRFTRGGADSHEVEAQSASAAVVAGRPFTVRQRSRPRIQRLGIKDALDYFADKANFIPGFRMFTIVIGINPINMSSVDRSAANIMRAIVEFIPGGALITQALDNYGVFDKVGNWVDQQIKSLGLTGAMFKKALDDFIDSLSWRDIFHLGDVWDRAKRIFTAPIDRLIAFAKNLLDGIIKFIKDAILKPLAKLAEGTRGWDLLIAVLGRNPITGEPVPRTAATLIPGFLKLIGQEEIWTNMQKANAIPRAWAWFQGALAGVMSFVSAIPSTFMAALRSLEIADIVLLPRAFVKVGTVFAGFIGNFISWAGKMMWNLLEIIFQVVSPGAWRYMQKTGAALKSILKNPLPFVGNLVRAAKLGFQNFAGNFLEHLKAGLIDWLTGSLPGVYIPQAFALPEIVKFALSVLGISWANVRQKLVKVVGEPAVKAMETGFKIVVTLVKDGPAAAWEQIKSELANLKDMVIGGITDFVVDTVVKKAIPKLISMFIPGAGFISAIISIYDTVMTFVQKISKIIQVVTGFIDSIVAIAAGAIGGAAKRVESTLAGLLSLAISFFAGFVGLGRVADKIMGVINKVRAPIDKAIDFLINWIVKTAKSLFAKVFGKDKDQKPDQRTDAQKAADLEQALGQSSALLNNKEMSIADIKKGLVGIKKRFNLTSLELKKQSGDDAQETDYVEGSVNPTKKTPAVTRVVGFKPPVNVDFECSPTQVAAGLWAEFQTQVKDQETGLNKLNLENWQTNVDNYARVGRDPKGAEAQEKARKDYRDRRIREELAKDKTTRTPAQKQKSAEAIADGELSKLAALHDPDQIAGGNPTEIKRLGSRRVNSSIGSQWRTKAPPFVSAVKGKLTSIAKTLLKTLHMNATLTPKK